MKSEMTRRSGMLALAVSVAMATPGLGSAAEKSFEIYGFAQLDYIQDFDRVNPNWDDTLRPSRIPTDPEQFGDDGQSSISVKQSRFGVMGSVPTARGPVNAKFEFDMFGVGGDEGQTTPRLRHAYGEFGQFLAGQTNSLFMDGDIFPNTIDYWGPTGMVFLRNPQIRWTPLSGDMSFAVAIENPSNDIDSGQFRTVPDFPGAQGDQEIPDLTMQYRLKTGFGHLQLAGILRRISTEVLCDTGETDPDAADFCPNDRAEVIFDDDDLGWGLDATSVINLLERNAIRLGFVYGEGIASYMNDGGMDAAPDRSVGEANVKLEAVQLTGVSAYYDHWWSARFSSSVGYSFTEVDNTAGQDPAAYQKGQYASVNLLYYPVENVMAGAEFLWGEREDLGGASNDDTRIQFSVKYNFGTKL